MTFYSAKEYIPDAPNTPPTSLGQPENTTIPFVEHGRENTKQTLKQGLVLCTRTEEWYTRKKSTMREVQLRKTRLRWRRFKAVLKPNRIELYHVTTILIRAERLAHVIYLNNQYPYRKVKLSLISAQDYIWCLEFLHYETKSLISYHFQSSCISDAKDWYMSVYRILPSTISSKTSIPPFVDIFVMIQKEKEQQFVVRLPLYSLIKNDNHDEDTLLNICALDIKPVIWSLLEKNGMLNMLQQPTTMNDIRLCWRKVSSSATYGEGAAATLKSSAISFHTPISGDQIEWVTKDTKLIGPELIEQKHRLELRSSTMDPQPNKSIIVSATFDGLLTQKIWSTGTTFSGKQTKCKRVNYYAILYGPHLFFMDRSYYFLCKRQREEQERKRLRTESSKYASIETKKQNNHWFSATTGGLRRNQQNNKDISAKKKKEWQFINRSTPQLTPSSSSVALAPHPNPSMLLNTRFLIDLNQVAHVRPMSQEGESNTFEVYFKNDHVLFYEASNTQTMLEWLALINHQLKLDPLQLISHHNGFDTNQSRPEHVKDILQSGLLYVKRDFTESFQAQYCLLTKNRQNDGGLLMFNTVKSKNQWWCHLNLKDDNTQQREMVSMYDKQRQLIHLKDSFVYSGDECILDKLLFQAKSKEPARYYADGAVTGGEKTSECVFVIWQIAKRHFVPNFREYLSLLKIGHRLGNRGSSWVFKARSKQERDEWVWALHKEFGVLRL
ncbi:hypothetical protein MFLAVUS_010412 [Mucor flavus]|uniref:PH domain-containing protein n=1 Tax=Mucor flavus TaxID=439312 RepID=A0ABP9ZCP2_9FUNG